MIHSVFRSTGPWRKGTREVLGGNFRKHCLDFRALELHKPKHTCKTDFTRARAQRVAGGGDVIDAGAGGSARSTPLPGIDGHSWLVTGPLQSDNHH